MISTNGTSVRLHAEGASGLGDSAQGPNPPERVPKKEYRAPLASTALVAVEVAFTLALLALSFALNWFRRGASLNETSEFTFLASVFLVALSLIAHVCWQKMCAALADVGRPFDADEQSKLHQIKAALVRQEVVKRLASPHSRECSRRQKGFEAAKQRACRDVMKSADVKRAIALCTNQLLQPAEQDPETDRGAQ